MNVTWKKIQIEKQIKKILNLSSKIILKTDSNANISCEFSENFQNCCECVCGGISFEDRNKRNFYIPKFCRKLYHVHWYVSLKSTSRNFGKSKGCYLTKNEHVTKILLKLLGNLGEELLCNEVVFYDMQFYKLQHSALPVFEIPENSWDKIYSIIPFLQKLVPADPTPNSCSKQFFENSQEGLQMFFKSTPR